MHTLWHVTYLEQFFHSTAGSQVKEEFPRPSSEPRGKSGATQQQARSAPAAGRFVRGGRSGRSAAFGGRGGQQTGGVRARRTEFDDNVNEYHYYEEDEHYAEDEGEYDDGETDGFAKAYVVKIDNERVDLAEMACAATRSGDVLDEEYFVVDSA